MNKKMIAIRAEKKLENVENVLEIIEPTQENIFNNHYEYNTEIPLSEDVYCRNVRKVVNINKQLGLMLEDETMFRELTPFDRAVHNAVCSLCYSGIESFTTEQVYRILVGDTSAQMHKSLKTSIEDSLRTLRNRIVGISFEEEGKYFGICLLTQDGDKIMEVNNYILPLAKVKLQLQNNKKIEAWQLLSEPPLLSYARIKRQIETISIEQLNIPLKLTNDNIKLREFLLNRIILIKSKTMKNGQLNSKFKNCNIINYDTIFELFNIDVSDHSSKTLMYKKRLLEKCEKLLNYWKNETGMLAKWIYNKNKAGEIIGFKLKINLDKFKLQLEDNWDLDDIQDEIERLEDVNMIVREESDESGELNYENDR